MPRSRSRSKIYVQSGFTAAEALAAATIVAARLVGRDAKTGSIKVGKNADLVLVDGDPSMRIGDLRQTRRQRSRESAYVESFFDDSILNKSA